MKKSKYPTKTSMNLFYKPDRTTKPSTIALYTLFVLVLLLGLSKWLVYDLWMEKQEAEQVLAATQEELSGVMFQLADYDEVQENYVRYSATDEERALVDRMEVLAMLESAAGDAEQNVISISGDQVQVQFSNVTLAQTAEIVSRLEASPLVAGTVVNTASTAGNAQGGTNWWGEQYAGEGWDLVQANITIQLRAKEAGTVEEAVEG